MKLILGSNIENISQKEIKSPLEKISPFEIFKLLIFSEKLFGTLLEKGQQELILSINIYMSTANTGRVPVLKSSFFEAMIRPAEANNYLVRLFSYSITEFDGLHFMPLAIKRNRFGFTASLAQTGPAVLLCCLIPFITQ